VSAPILRSPSYDPDFWMSIVPSGVGNDHVSFRSNNVAGLRLVDIVEKRVKLDHRKDTIFAVWGWRETLWAIKVLYFLRRVSATILIF
jgi:hypothetical protein